MYWQKRFDRENPDKAIEKEILDIRKENPTMDIEVFVKL